MGRGDKRTKRGKIWRGTYGNSRPKNSKVAAAAKAVAVEQKAAPEAKPAEETNKNP